MNPTVSIIVPVYNAEETISRCIESILNQEYRDFELLLMNDGSADSSGDICDRYAKDDPRIRVIHKSNTGVSETRNMALDLACGTYLQFLDSDDWLDREALLRVLDVLRGFVEEGNGVDMLLANYVYEKPSLHKHKSIRYDGVFPEGVVFGWNDVKRFRMSQNIFIHYSPVIAPSDNSVFMDNHTADRNLSQGPGLPSLPNGRFHIFFIRCHPHFVSFRLLYKNSINIPFPSE